MKPKRYRSHPREAREFFNAIAIEAKTGDYSTVTKIYYAMLNVILKDAISGRTTLLPQFGRLETYLRKAGRGRFYKTGEIFISKPTLLWRFRPFLSTKTWLKENQTKIVPPKE